MALKTTYVTRDNLWPFWFGSPRCYPGVLVAMQIDDPIWAVSSCPRKIPMAGIDIETTPGVTVTPDIDDAVQVGPSSWYLVSNESPLNGDPILSVMYLNSPTSFERIIDLEAPTLSTPYAVDTDPKHAVVLCTYKKDGAAVFSGTNFELVSYIKPDCGSVLACIDIEAGREHPAWVIDRNLMTLFLPDYSVNRPIDNHFDLSQPCLTRRQRIAVIVTATLVGIGLLFAMPLTRYLIADSVYSFLDRLAYVVPIEGFQHLY